jgi:hypothetical protein
VCIHAIMLCKLQTPAVPPPGYVTLMVMLWRSAFGMRMAPVGSSKSATSVALVSLQYWPSKLRGRQVTYMHMSQRGH